MFITVIHKFYRLIRGSPTNEMHITLNFYISKVKLLNLNQSEHKF